MLAEDAYIWALRKETLADGDIDNLLGYFEFIGIESEGFDNLLSTKPSIVRASTPTTSQVITTALAPGGTAIGDTDICLPYQAGDCPYFCQQGHQLR